jgi:hypothetical protein
MASYTKAQVEKWNNQLGNGWKLDLQTLVVWNEKRPKFKYKKNESDDILYTFDINFTEDRQGYEYLGTYSVDVCCQKWREEGDVMISHGLGVRKRIAVSISNKKMFKILADMTKKLDKTTLLSMFDIENPEVNAKLENGFIL